MSNALRRFEILLPQRFNDGQAVPHVLYADTVSELRTAFGAASWETQIIRGFWDHAGESYGDELIRVFVDVPDTPENWQFFVDFKETLKVRFQQIDIRITTYLIEAF